MSLRRRVAGALVVLVCAPPPFVTATPKQAMASVDQVLLRLDASDPIVRRDARADLARRGKPALAIVLKALQDPRASSRFRLGLIGVLNDMTGITADDAHGAPFASILRAVGDADPGLADEAYRFFTKYIVAGSIPAVSESKAGLDVRVKAARSSDGEFAFLFNANPTSSGIQVTLREIACYEDSSTGTTRWLFSVFAGSQTFGVSEQRYGDAGRPQRYQVSAFAKSRVQDYAQQSVRLPSYTLLVPMAAKVPLRVVGYKPKHVQ